MPRSCTMVLLELGSTIVQDRGIVTYFHLLRGSVDENAVVRKRLLAEIDEKVARDYPNVFYRVDVVDDIYRGTVSAAQSYGLGNFEANTVMLGWPQKKERSETYVAMLHDLSRLDRSLLLVSHRSELAFGVYRHIQIWWGGLQGNGGLMLLIAYLITAHERWRRARVSVVTVVRSKEEQGNAARAIQRILEGARLVATPRVILRGGRSIQEIMRAESVGVDLAIIGIRLPEPGDDVETFFDRMSSLLGNLPTTIMVHSARDFQGEPVLFDTSDAPKEPETS